MTSPNRFTNVVAYLEMLNASVRAAMRERGEDALVVEQATVELSPEALARLR